MNRKTSTTPRPYATLRLLMAVTAVAVGVSLTQVAWAQPDGGRGGHEMVGSPRQMERMLDEVKATPEQRAQIKQLTEAARADMAAQHSAGRQLREQNRALFTQPTVDARTAEVLRQQMLAQHDQASKRRLQVKLDISRVLSPEQRALLAQRMKMHEDRMQQRKNRDEATTPRS